MDMPRAASYVRLSHDNVFTASMCISADQVLCLLTYRVRGFASSYGSGGSCACVNGHWASM